MKLSKVFVLVCTLTFYLLPFTHTYAQDVPVPNPPVPCNQVRPDLLHPLENEFHSLRPYQASATCVSTVSNYARFCGNKLTLKDTVRGSYRWDSPYCHRVDNRVYCDFDIHVDKPITIDLSKANLPIMGNTEEVTNYKGEADKFDDAQKVNEYVSWYLNGVINRKEYPENVDDKSVVNFSGPINKLIPQEIQLAKRVETIENATNKNLGSNQKTIQRNRHDQVVVCTPPLSGKPTNCDLLNKKYRLSFWTGKILFNQYIDTFIELLVKLVPGLERSVIGELLRTQKPWIYKYPPLSWNFDSSVKYRKAYNEWQGKVCIIVPVINILVCANNPFVPDKYADLFPFIPLSSTEDLKGGVSIENVSSAAQENTDVDVTNVTFSNQTPADLFFSHMQESDDLGGLLQSTFAQKGADLTGSPTNVDTATCEIVDVRSNKGDNLFAGEISGTLSYNASFTCDFPPLPPGSPITLYCEKEITINLSTVSDSPKADDVWSRLVAGPASIFKRIFPKTNVPGSVGTILDMPGSTEISYTGDGVSTNDTELKLPHLGGISEYFLKGIQTMLRPKGYGEPISFGNATEEKSCNGQTELPDLPEASNASCKICGYKLVPTLKKIIESASQTFGVPGSVILGTMYHEGAFSRGLGWSEENVIKWSLCGGEVPGCDKNATSTAQIPFGWIPFYFYGDSKFWGASRTVDPARTKENVSPCNVLDGIYATAAALKMWSGGLPTSFRFPISMDPGQTYSRFPDMCYGWDLNNGSGTVTSCGAWNVNTVATSQVGYGGWCPEPGKHPIQSYFPDGSGWIDQTVNYFSSYACR